MSKRLGGIIGCKDKTSSWHLKGFPCGRNIGSRVSCRGEAHRYTAHLLKLIAMQGHQAKTKHKQCSTSSNRIVTTYCFMGCKDKTSTWHLNGFPDGSNLESTV